MVTGPIQLAEVWNFRPELIQDIVAAKRRCCKGKLGESAQGHTEGGVNIKALYPTSLDHAISLLHQQRVCGNAPRTACAVARRL